MSGARAKRAPPAGAWSNLRPRDSIRSADRETRRTASRNLTEPSSPDPFSSLSVPPAAHGFAEHFRPTDEQSMAEPQGAAPKRRLYTRPWRVTLNQVILLNTELLDYHCLDNEKDAKHLVGK